jgi:hypothetical protein
MKNKDTQLLEEAYNSIQTKQHPKYSLITNVRHAIKTGDKAKEALAREELYQFATRYNLMKDPEVLEFLPDDSSDEHGFSNKMDRDQQIRTKLG